MSDRARIQDDRWAHDRAEALLSMIEQLQGCDVLHKSQAGARVIYARIALGDPPGEQRVIRMVPAGHHPVVLAAMVELMVITGRLIEIEPGELWCAGVRWQGDA